MRLVALYGEYYPEVWGATLLVRVPDEMSDGAVIEALEREAGVRAGVIRRRLDEEVTHEVTADGTVTPLNEEFRFIRECEEEAEA